LYHYGKADSAIWLNDKDHIKAALLETLLGYESMLVVEKAHGVDNTKVTVSKEADSYSVNISRTNNGKEESFANTFNNPGALAVFIEKYTLVTVADFEAKYAR
jgi:dienelactone hydrolase